MSFVASEAHRTILGLRGTCGLLGFEAESLRGNALGDPVRRELPVYLPPGEHRELPVLYFLPSYSSHATRVLSFEPWKENFFQRVDRLILEGRMRPAAVVAVDGWTRFGGSQYVDSVHNGKYATMLAREIVPLAEEALPINRDPGARGILGHSSGGFGALHVVTEFPGVFGAIAAHSADGYFPYAVLGGFSAARRELRAAGSIAKFVEGFEAGRIGGQGAFDAIITLAYASAYSPLSQNPFDFDLPFDMASGAVRMDVFERWGLLDPAERSKDAAVVEAFRALRGVYVDCGNRDEYGLDTAARLLVGNLRAGGVEVTYEEFAGLHSGTPQRYDDSLAFFSRVLTGGA